MPIRVLHQDSGNRLKRQMFDECTNLLWLMCSRIAGKIKNDLGKGEVLRKLAEFKIFIKYQGHLLGRIYKLPRKYDTAIEQTKN